MTTAVFDRAAGAFAAFSDFRFMLLPKFEAEAIIMQKRVNETFGMSHQHLVTDIRTQD
jgi:hypothetical protein